MEYDTNSEESNLVFDVTFPFYKRDYIEDKSLVSDLKDTYKCAHIVMSILKNEFIKHGHIIPEYFDKAHLIIINKMLENEPSKIQYINE